MQGTPLDFTSEGGTLLGERICQVEGGGEHGLDHNLVVDKEARKISQAGEGEGGAVLVARVNDETSGRAMEVFTTEPGLQVYTCNFASKDPADAPHLQVITCFVMCFLNVRAPPM